MGDFNCAEGGNSPAHGGHQKTRIDEILSFQPARRRSATFEVTRLPLPSNSRSTEINTPPALMIRIDEILSSNPGGTVA
jgi:hypothetical protein